MAAQSQILTTEVAGRRILHSLVTRDSPRGLLIMLPGRGYLNVYPVMHYLRTVGVTLGYDVLSITYAFQSQLYGQEEIGGDLLEETRQAADQVFDQRSYTHMVIAGKSMGTPLASFYGSELATRFPEAEIRHLMLTPIRGATQGVEQRRTLAVIGTADPAYDAALIQADGDKPWIEWLVLENLNHGLEHESSWQESVAGLGVILSACHRFLDGVQ